MRFLRATHPYIRLRQGFIYLVAIMDLVQPVRAGLGSIHVDGQRILACRRWTGR